MDETRRPPANDRFQPLTEEERANSGLVEGDEHQRWTAAEAVAEFWDGGESIIATIGAEYLSSRRIREAVGGCDVVRFHSAFRANPKSSPQPALIFACRTLEGLVTRIHVVVLNPDGSKDRKLTLGTDQEAGASYIRLDGDGEAILCEGPEDALAFNGILKRPVIAAMSIKNLEKAGAGLNSVTIQLERGSEDTAREQAQALAKAGCLVRLAKPPEGFKDVNEILTNWPGEFDGDAVIATVLKMLDEAEPFVLDSDQSDAMGVAVGQTPIGFIQATNPLPEMRANEGNLARLTDSAWKLLSNSNDPPWLYRSGNGFVWVEPGDDGLPFIKSVTENRMRHILARLADWQKLGRDGESISAHPPMALVKNILATPDPPLPVLEGIITAPVFGNDGSLVTSSGYNRATKLLYAPAPHFVLPLIPKAPTVSEIKAAVSLLLDELLSDFPFTGDAERAHVLALLLLPFMRPMVTGPTPLHLIEKPAPGTGASLLVDAISVIATGAAALTMVEGANDDEWRKRITTMLLRVPTTLLIDNLRRRLDAPSLSAALTATYWADRLLGGNELCRVPIRCAWIATGNNPQASNEIARRLVRIRLDAGTDKPWMRRNFRHENLLDWVRQVRPRLVAACLTLGQAWISAGMPECDQKLGSFESWSSVMGGILNVAGVPGFLTNLEDLYERADAEGAASRNFVASWWEKHQSTEVGTSDLYQAALSSEPPMPLGSGNDQSQRIRLGKALAQMRDRVFEIEGLQLRVTKGEKRQRAQQWRLDRE